MVRVYKVMRVNKDSKRYCAENRGCKAWLAGQFILVGILTTYGLKSVLSMREAFEQLEDSNVPKKAKKTKSCCCIIIILSVCLFDRLCNVLVSE